MSNLTISLDEELIKQARVRAIRQGTSLSAKIREFLTAYASQTDEAEQRRRDEATDRLMAAIQAAAAEARPEPAAPASPGQPRRTLRDEMYEGDFRARDRRKP